MKVAIIGCGFVADYYMASLAQHPSLRVVAAMDHDPAAARRFGDFWKLPVFTEAEALLKGADFALVLNLTSTEAHFTVSSRFLAAGKHVYSEKPMALTMSDARALVDQAAAVGLMIASAPCNHLSEAAQAIGRQLAAGAIGTPRLVYAEMDDAFIALSTFANWRSASGAPWPYRDEFEIGCTLEHAAYYVTWLAYFFGPVARVAAWSALLHPGKPVKPGRGEAADLSVAVLEFRSGVVARLTCSFLAPRDHSLRVIGTEGVLTAEDCWLYRTKVRTRRYLKIRNRFMLSPLARRVRLVPTGPKARRTGAGAVDFARGPAAMAQALGGQGPVLLPADFCLHFTEVMLAINQPAGDGGFQTITTSFAPLPAIEAPIL